MHSPSTRVSSSGVWSWGRAAITISVQAVAGSILLLCVATGRLPAAEAEIQTLPGDLKAPQGVAIRPGATTETYEIFVADPAGGRIVKIHSADFDNAVAVVTGFAEADTEGSGPAALHFLDRRRFFVAGFSGSGIRVYDLPESGDALSADDAVEKIEDQDIEAVLGIARTRPNDSVSDFLLLACSRRGGASGLVKVPIRAGIVGKPESFAPEAVSGPATAVAVSPHGYIACVTSNGTSDGRGSVLSFVNPIDEDVVMRVPLPLEKVVDLAYHPATGGLYALDAAPSEESRGGLFRIEAATGSAAKSAAAVRVTAMSRATALAFAPDGSLYITSLEESKDQGADAGKLIRIRGDL